MLKAIFCIVGLLLVFSFNHSINAEDNVSELEQTLAELIQNKEWDEALVIIDKILENDPENHDMLNNKGSIYLEREEYDKAIKIFDDILEKDSNNSQTLNNKGIALLREGYIIDAYEIFYSALVVDPKNKVAFENLDKITSHIAWLDETEFGYSVLSIRNSDGVLSGYSLSDKIQIHPPLGYILLEQRSEKITIDGENYLRYNAEETMKTSQYLGYYSIDMVFDKQPIGVVYIDMNGLIVKEGDILSYELLIPERDFSNWKKSAQLK